MRDQYRKGSNHTVHTHTQIQTQTDTHTHANTESKRDPRDRTRSVTGTIINTYFNGVYL